MLLSLLGELCGRKGFVQRSPLFCINSIHDLRSKREGKPSYPSKTTVENAK